MFFFTFSQLFVCCLDFYCRAVFHLKGLHSAALSVDGFEGAGQRSPFKEGQVVVAWPHRVPGLTAGHRDHGPQLGAGHLYIQGPAQRSSRLLAPAGLILRLETVNLHWNILSLAWLLRYKV